MQNFHRLNYSKQKQEHDKKIIQDLNKMIQSIWKMVFFYDNQL